MQKTTKLVQMYKEAEERSIPCAGGRTGTGGRAFLKADRAALVSEIWNQNLTVSQAGYAIYKELGGSSDNLHTQRLRLFEIQVNKGVLRLGKAITGEHVGVVKVKNPQDIAFDGRIKSQADIQPAFNRAARQLIKVGVTTPDQAVKYINSAFATARLEQKIDIKAERIVNELRIGDMTKAEVLMTLDRVKSQF
jgi:hypothetical protein